MTGVVLRIVVLTAVYLAVLASAKPLDVATGAGVATLVVLLERRRRPTGTGPSTGLASRLAGVPALVGGTVLDVARGCVEVSRCCLGRPPDPGIVRIPLEPTAPTSAAAWGVRLGITPNTVVVDVDAERGELLVHVLDARDPEAVRAEQLAAYRRRQRRVFP